MRQKVGLILFWVAAIWTFFWGILGSVHMIELYGHDLTFEQFQQTIWATDGSLMNVWGFALPLGVILAGIGLLMGVGARGSTVGICGIGVFLGVVLSSLVGSLGHLPPLFAVGGCLILVFFFGILWLWAKERRTLEGQSAVAADLKLVGYLFILIACWFTCGIAGFQWIQSFADQPPMIEPIMVQILFVLGWLFLFLGHHRTSKQL